MTYSRLRGNIGGLTGFGTTGTAFSAGAGVRPNEALNYFGNLPNYREYLNTPPTFDADELMDQLYSYNLPDWWWLYKLLHGSEFALLVPIMAGVAAGWLIGQMVRRESAPDVNVGARDDKVAGSYLK